MITAYLRERFRPVVFVPLAITIAAAGATAGFDVVQLAIDASSALLLLAEFRLWDDLADRRADSATHPERVLVRATSLRPFVAVLVGLAVVNITGSVIRDSTGLALAAVLALHGLLGLWYARRSTRTLLGDQLLLAKYPALVVIVAGARATTAPLTIGLVAAALYAAVSLYEAWHDPASPVGMLLGGRS